MLCSLQQRISCDPSLVDLSYEEQKTAVLLGVTLLGDSRSLLVLRASGVTLQDAPQPVSAHALAEGEAFPPRCLLSTYCVGGEPTEGH